MNVIIYGNEQPRLGFTQSPQGGISFRVENERVVQFDPDQKNISWGDLYPKKNLIGRAPYSSKPDSQVSVKLFKEFVAELSILTGSETEKRFFEGYATECVKPATDPWDVPALIPQVWVNWIHYDPKDSSRAARAQKEPFRVDFALKNEEISPNLIIIEIDGPTHFGKHSVDPMGKTILHASMEAYTEHLRKDRWLRKQGWQVFRISSKEVDECKNIDSLFFEVFETFVTGLPF